MTDSRTLGQSVPKEGLFLMDGIEGLRSLPKHSVDMLLTDPPYGTTRNYWDVPLPLPELWEAVKWAVKPNGAVLFFAQCPFDKVLGASNLAMLRYEWIWYKERGTGFLNANRAPLKSPRTSWCFTKSPRSTIHSLLTASHIPVFIPEAVQALTMGNLNGRAQSPTMAAAIPEMCFCAYGVRRHPSHTEARGALRVFDPHLYPSRRIGRRHLRGLRHNRDCSHQHRTSLCML